MTFKIKLQKKPQQWKKFNYFEDPLLKNGDVIRIKDSTGTYRVTNVVKQVAARNSEENHYNVYLEIILPRNITGDRKLCLFSGDEYRIIGK